MLSKYWLELLLASLIGPPVAGYLRGFKRGQDDSVHELLDARWTMPSDDGDEEPAESLTPDLSSVNRAAP